MVDEVDANDSDFMGEKKAAEKRRKEAEEKAESRKDRPASQTSGSSGHVSPGS